MQANKRSLFAWIMIKTSKDQRIWYQSGEKNAEFKKNEWKSFNYQEEK